MTRRAALPAAAGVLLAATCASASEGAGLRGEYFAGSMNLDGEPALVRVDPGIDFDWAEGAPHEKVGANIYSVRWTGFIVAPVSGEYELHLSSDDGSRMWLDDELVIDSWSDHAMEERTVKVALEAGVARRVKIEYYENMVYAGARLEWTPPPSAAAGASKGERHVIPASSLFVPGEDLAPPVVATVAAGGGVRHPVGATVRIVLSEEHDEEGLTGNIRITSEQAGYEAELTELRALPGGVYVAEWDTTGLAPATDYAVETVLTDAAGNSDPDGLARTPDLVIALGSPLRGGPLDGPPRPGCAPAPCDGGTGALPSAVLSALLILATVARSAGLRHRREAAASVNS